MSLKKSILVYTVAALIGVLSAFYLMEVIVKFASIWHEESLMSQISTSVWIFFLINGMFIASYFIREAFK